jgi:hypothetical protein
MPQRWSPIKAINATCETHEQTCKVLLAALFAFGTADAFALDTESREGAVEAAEQFIREGKYDTARRCPEKLTRLDAQKLYDMQPHCRHYAASEGNAHAVQETEIFWLIFFRKVPPSCYEGDESFRVVQVFRHTFPSGSRVQLKDVELFLPREAVTLGRDKPMQRTCEA